MFIDIDTYIGQQYVLMQRTASKCGGQKTTKKNKITGPSEHPEGKWWNGSYTNTNQQKSRI